MHSEVKVLLLIAVVISRTSCQDCGKSSFSENHGYLMSPNYPDKYNHDSDCAWTIHAPEGHFVQIVFEEFDVKNPFWDCSDDYVTVIFDKDKSEKFCNEYKPPEVLKSTTNNLTIRLQTDEFFSNGIGFKAEFFVVDRFGNKLPEEGSSNISGNDTITATNVVTASSASPAITATETIRTSAAASTASLTTATEEAPAMIIMTLAASRTTSTVKTTSVATTTSTAISAAATTDMAAATPSAGTEEAGMITTLPSAKTTEFFKMKFIPSVTSSIAIETAAKTSSGGIDNGVSINSDATPGAVVGVVIGVVLIMLGIIIILVFVCYRQKKGERDFAANADTPLRTVV